MGSFRIAISTQSPLLRFLGTSVNPSSPNGDRPVRLSDLKEGTDYAFSVGGLCRTMLPSVREWIGRGWLKEADWFSLQTEGPESLFFDGLPLRIHHLRLPPKELRAYARVKEKLWADLHGISTDGLDLDDFRFYSRYNWFTEDSVLATTRGLDLAYVHDFQLLQMGALIGLAAPSVLRWHVPFVPGLIPRYTRQFLVRAMEDFDAIIVSARRDLEGLLKAGFRGVARQIYPTIDPSAWPDASPGDLEEFEHRLGISADDQIILHVGRMDPAKRQDVLLRALKRLAASHPKARAVFVGNGSFSSSKRGGLGLDKSKLWSQKLAELTRELGLGDRAIFAHWVPDRLLRAAYARAQVVVLTSDLEGFGLTALEAWRYRRPVVVSTGAGVAELVHPGLNGYTFRPGNDEELAKRLDRLLSDPAHAAEQAESGAGILKSHNTKRLAPVETEILESAIQNFRRT